MARHGTRYLKVLRGNDQAAKRRLLQYLDGQIDVSYTRTQQPKRTAIYWVRPFGVDFPAAVKIMQSVKRFSDYQTVNFARAFVLNYVFGPPTVVNQLVLKGVLAPRVAITLNRNTTGTTKTSQLTGKTYKSYSGETVIYPYGAGTSASDKSEETVFKVIFQRTKADNSRNGCSYSPGSWSV
jgi:hypothetical protein